MTGPRDDPTILDSDELWRRIHPKWWVADHNRGANRLSSAAFELPRDGTGISVELAALRETRAQALDGYDGYGLASIQAQVPRLLDLGIVRQPQAGNPAHAEIVGDVTRRKQRSMAGAATMLVIPVL